jgi:dipeptide/tripeptide permease
MNTKEEPTISKVKTSRKQTKIASFLESLSNEFIGYIINTIVQLAVFPLFGLHLSLSLNLLISSIHSFFGLIRIYILRRLFNITEKHKKQNKRSSLLESITNIVSGTLISFVAQLYVYPLVGVVMAISTNIGVTIVFLILTLIRLYVLRRIFNNRTAAKRKAKKAAKKALKLKLKRLK